MCWQEMSPEEEVQLLHSFAQQHRLYRNLAAECHQEHSQQQVPPLHAQTQAS